MQTVKPTKAEKKAIERYEACKHEWCAVIRKGEIWVYECSKCNALKGDKHGNNQAKKSI